tara:strand:- start:2536 stop:5508 length:2973 start_codon:yes stop_codon:yes gene_type:complete
MRKSTFQIISLISLFILGDITTLFAQDSSIGFSQFNNRNHPELDWQSAETDHFIISYPKHLEGIENEAAAIAEATYDALSGNFGITFDYKIRIFLSDEDEIVNGFAVPYPRSYTNIWVHLNDVAESWSGPEKWLRTVVAHELAHIFHFEAVKSNIPLIGTLGTVPGLTAPWVEGIAQYQTEPWHAFRGDALLRAAFYDGRPSFRDNSSIRNGQLMYASGNSQLRYFASAYGDSLFPKLLAHREKKLGGLIQYHNFENAFKETTGTEYNAFQDEWRRHLNIYYHTLAGQMERSDSLGVNPKSLPGLLKSDVKYSPDTTKIAVVSILSSQRPYRILYVAANDSTAETKILDEGSIKSPISWSPNGTWIAYSKNTRGVNSSLLNDIYMVHSETEEKRRITHSRRASYPVFSLDGSTLYYVVSEAGTGNIVRYHIENKTETSVTHYTDDVQLGQLAMHPGGSHLAYAVFDENGDRKIAVVDLNNLAGKYYTDPETDDRNPVWSPDGQTLLYTSLRDYVPNIFAINPFEEDSCEERVTAQFTGARALQWLPADSTHQSGRIVLLTTDTKRDNEIYVVDASKRAEEPTQDVNPSYTKWLTHEPPNTIPPKISADASLIKDRYRYNSLKNLSHITTIPFPVFGNNDYGVGVVTSFIDPLDKHMINVLGMASFVDFKENSLFLLSYMNNQLRPSLSFNFYHNSFTGRIYERDFLVTTNSGGFLLASLPRDWVDSPFVSSIQYSRLRYDFTDGKRFWEPDVTTAILGLPESGWQSDLLLGLRMKSQKPYVHNNIHPLDGWGFEPRITLATKVLGGKTEYIRPDIRAYTILPAIGNSRFYLYGRAIAQEGDSFNQDYIGFSRYDELEFGDLMPGLNFLYNDTERVRGFSDYVPGNRMLFGTLEYRMPFLSSFQTEFLGLISLGRTTLSAFLDAGAVWSETDRNGARTVTSRAGAGFEVKNVLNIGPLSIIHSLGFAQPVPDFGGSKNREIYYRVKTTIPF